MDPKLNSIRAVAGGPDTILKTIPTTAAAVALTAKDADWATTGTAVELLAAADNDQDLRLVGAHISAIIPVGGENTQLEGEVIIYDDSGDVADYKAIIQVTSSQLGVAANTSRRDVSWTPKVPIAFEQGRKISAVFVTGTANADTCKIKLQFARNVR